MFSHFNRSSATVLNKVMSMQRHMLYKINYFFLLKTYVSSLGYLKQSLYLAFRFIAQFFDIFVFCIYIYMYIHKYDSLFRSCPSWVFLLEVRGELAEWFPCRSVISIELLCSFVGVTLRRGCSVNLLCIFRAPHWRRI